MYQNLSVYTSNISNLLYVNYTSLELQFFKKILHYSLVL